MTLVDLNLKIQDALVTAYCKARQRAEQGSDFLRIFYNGRADALHDAEDIVGEILLNLNEDILLEDPWINASKKTPEGHCKRVLIFPSNTEFGHIAYHSDGKWYSNGNQKIESPTHWRYIPENPK